MIAATRHDCPTCTCTAPLPAAWVGALHVVTLPAPIVGLSDVERTAIMEVIGVAEDLSLRGDDRAAVALGWMRDLLNAKETNEPGLAPG